MYVLPRAADVLPACRKKFIRIRLDHTTRLERWRSAPRPKKCSENRGAFVLPFFFFSLPKKAKNLAAHGVHISAKECLEAQRRYGLANGPAAG